MAECLHIGLVTHSFAHQAYAHAHGRTHVDARTRTRTRSHARTCTHARAPCTHAHAHAYTHARALARSRPLAYARLPTHPSTGPPTRPRAHVSTNFLFDPRSDMCSKRTDCGLYRAVSPQPVYCHQTSGKGNLKSAGRGSGRRRGRGRCPGLHWLMALNTIIHID